MIGQPIRALFGASLLVLAACGARPLAGDESTSVTALAPAPSSSPRPAAATPVEPAPELGEPVDPLALLSPALELRLANLPVDPPPPDLIRGSHYWISNELSHFVWHDELAGKGGVYLGVGTDQNYLLAGWAQAELLLVVDFDREVVALHGVYALIFAEAETPEEFLRLWSKDASEEVGALIEVADLDPAERKAIARSYRRARSLVHKRLVAERARYRERELPTYLDDQGQYDHVRTLWRNHRVFAINGDYGADATLQALGEALNEAGLEISVLYLSNIEQYLDYTPELRRNVLGLPFAEDSVVLRTLGWSKFGFVPGEQYHYSAQSGRNFEAWLEHSRVTGLPKMLNFRSETGVAGYSKIEREPERSAKPPEIAK